MLEKNNSCHDLLSRKIRGGGTVRADSTCNFSHESGN
jgi:hypothetical protein